MPTYIKELPSQDYLLSKFYVKDGLIYWKERKMSKGRPSKKAHSRITTYLSNDYVRVAIDQDSYALSRVIYQMVHGGLTPEFEIDHIDMDKLNNRVENLRKVSQEVNKRNKPLFKVNKTGKTGVQLTKKYHPKPHQETFTMYYAARWRDINGVARSKCFRIDKLGEEEAFRLACEYRKKMIEQMSELEYSDIHGLPKPGGTDVNAYIREHKIAVIPPKDYK